MSTVSDAGTAVGNAAVKPHYVTTMALGMVVVVAGQWKEGKGIQIRTVLGFFGCAIILSLMAEADDGLADGFSYLILAGALFKYLPYLFNGQKGNQPKSATNPQGVSASTLPSTAPGRSTGLGKGSDAIGGGSVPAIDKLPPNLGKLGKQLSKGGWGNGQY